jgi:hypothetical protein
MGHYTALALLPLCQHRCAVLLDRHNDLRGVNTRTRAANKGVLPKDKTIAALRVYVLGAVTAPPLPGVARTRLCTDLAERARELRRAVKACEGIGDEHSRPGLLTAVRRVRMLEHVLNSTRHRKWVKEQMMLRIAERGTKWKEAEGSAIRTMAGLAINLVQGFWT